MKESSTNSKKIIIVSFTAHPRKGSEFAVGWNLPLWIAQNSTNEIYVLIGTFQGNGFGKFHGLSEEILPPNLKFIKIYPDFLVQFFNFFNQYLKLGFMFYPALKRWNLLAYKYIIKSFNLDEIWITHQLCPIGFREPGYLYKLNKRHIWGPIGGAQYINLSGIKKSFYSYKLKSGVKNYLNEIQLKGRRVSLAVKNSNALIFSNKDNFHSFKKTFAIQDENIISETGMKLLNKKLILKKFNNHLDCIVVGSLTPRKNIDLLLDVFRELPQDKFSLSVIGSGNQYNRIQRTLKKKNISNIKLEGKVEYKNVPKLIEKAHLLLLPSHSEANTNVVWESFSVYTPIISFNRNGMKTSIIGKGILIDDFDYSSNKTNWINALNELFHNPTKLIEFQFNILKEREELTWENNAKKILEIYSR